MYLRHAMSYPKEIVERRQGEPIKFLFLPKLGLLGSQASTMKKKLIVNCEQLLRDVFHVFMDKMFVFLIFCLHCSVPTKKFLKIKVKKKYIFWEVFFWIKNWVFLGLVVLVIE